MNRTLTVIGIAGLTCLVSAAVFAEPAQGVAAPRMLVPKATPGAPAQPTRPSGPPRPPAPLTNEQHAAAVSKIQTTNKLLKVVPQQTPFELTMAGASAGVTGVVMWWNPKSGTGIPLPIQNVHLKDYDEVWFGSLPGGNWLVDCSIGGDYKYLTTINVRVWNNGGFVDDNVPLTAGHLLFGVTLTTSNGIELRGTGQYFPDWWWFGCKFQPITP